MRDDMYEVIIERPRRGGGYKVKGQRTAQKTKDDLESSPTKEPMRDARQRTKELNENLAPLFRFLRKNVGRPWNKVFSEVCAKISSKTGVQKHVRDHVVQYVEINEVILIDGIPYNDSRYGLRPLYSERGTLYVCPKSGLLKIAKPPKKAKPLPPTEVHRLDRGQVAVRVRGQWLLCEMKKFLTSLGYPFTLHSDVIFGPSSEGELKRTYGSNQYAIKSRPMNKREIAYAMSCPIATK